MKMKRHSPSLCLGLNLCLIFLLFIFYMFLVSIPFLSWAQGRSLGFKGLIPPAKAKRHMFKGKIVLIDLPLIKIRDSLWRSSKVFVGPPTFIQEQRFHLQIGQHLIIWAVPMKVEGNEILAAFEIENEDTGKTILLRNEQGEPVWWGGSRGQDIRGRKERPK